MYKDELVDQDYTLLESVLKELGIDIIEMPRIKTPVIDIERIAVTTQIN